MNYYKVDHDPLNMRGSRNIRNTDKADYNCGGYALGTFSWYLPSRTREEYTDIMGHADIGDMDTALTLASEAIVNELPAGQLFRLVWSWNASILPKIMKSLLCASVIMISIFGSWAAIGIGMIRWVDADRLTAMLSMMCGMCGTTAMIPLWFASSEHANKI